MGLVAIAAALVALHLTLNIKADRYSHLAMSIVFWLAAFSVLEDKRDQLKFGSGLGASCLGIALLVGVFLKSATFPQGNFLSVAPLMSGLGLALLASGFRGLGQYRQALFVLVFLGVPRLVLRLLPDISPLTAKFSAFVLWYTGIPMSLQGNYIFVPDGGIEVVPSCSGLTLITYMLALTGVFLMLFPTQRLHKIVAPMVAAGLGFGVNAVRVALLATLSTEGSQQAFEYWHSKGGALIFVMIAVILLGLFCWLLLRQSMPPDSNWEEFP